MTTKTRTLLLALALPGRFDPEEVDPEEMADEIVMFVNEHREGYDRVMVSAIPAAQWLTAKTMAALKRPVELADALLRTCMYLDGFVWVTDPEASEIEGVKATVVEALGCKNWSEAMDLARLREARRQT